MPVRHLVAMSLPVLTCSLPAFGADDPYRLRVDVGTWYVAPGGGFKMPGNERTIDAPLFNMDSPRLAPVVDVRVRKGDYRLFMSGMTFAADNRGAVFDDPGRFGMIEFFGGDTIRASLDFTTLKIGGAYEVFEYALDDAEAFSSSFMVSGGVRFYEVGFHLQLDRTSGVSFNGVTDQDVDLIFAEPFVGVRADMDVEDFFTMEVFTDFGAMYMGDRESFSWDVGVGFVFRPVDNVGVRLGYRQLLFDLIEGDDVTDFDWNGTMAGVMASLELRF